MARHRIKYPFGGFTQELDSIKTLKKMLHLHNPKDAKRWCQKQRTKGHTIGFIATMGALHQGHIALVHQAASENDLTVVSIFVNPLQFNRAEDLKHYPRQAAEDSQLLISAQCDMLFTGEVHDFYPEQDEPISTNLPSAGPFSQGLEGSHRPGHFKGVREIVSRLFATVGPCRAYFGQKDFQQTLIVKDLARDFKDIEVVTCPTIREPSGLAMSSRNVRLSKADKVLAESVYRALNVAKRAWEAGERLARPLQEAMLNELKHPRILVEYAELRNPEQWQKTPQRGTLTQAQALIAVDINGVRLIDNLYLGGT